MDIEAIRKQVEQQVMQYFHLEPTVTDAPYAGMVTGVDVISHLEHSLLNPDTTLETIERECAVARKYSVAAVCVAPYYVPAAREILLGSPVAVGTAIGFPHGCMSKAAKLAELPPVAVYEPEYVPRPPQIDTSEPLSIQQEDNTWLVEGPWLQRLMANINFSDYESRMYFDKMLRQSGLFDQLERMGIQDGDIVSMYNLEFEYQR